MTRLLEAKEITGKKCEVVTLLAPSGVKARAALVVGLGTKDAFDRGIAFRAASAAAKSLAGKERSRVAFFLSDQWPAEQLESAVAGSAVGCAGQDLYRAKKNRFPFGEIVWAASDSAAVSRGEESVAIAKRAWPEDSVEWATAAEARRVQRYRMKWLGDLDAELERDPVEARGVIALFKLLPREQDVLVARLEARDIDPMPPAGWREPAPP